MTNSIIDSSRREVASLAYVTVFDQNLLALSQLPDTMVRTFFDGGGGVGGFGPEGYTLLGNPPNILPRLLFAPNRFSLVETSLDRFSKSYEKFLTEIHHGLGLYQNLKIKSFGINVEIIIQFKTFEEFEKYCLRLLPEELRKDGNSIFTQLRFSVKEDDAGKLVAFDIVRHPTKELTLFVQINDHYEHASKSTLLTIEELLPLFESASGKFDKYEPGL